MGANQHKAALLRTPKLPSVAPNRGIEAEYRREMQRLIDAMQKDYLKQISAVYERNLSDEELVAEVNNILNKLSLKWGKRFDHNAERLAWRFTRQLDHRTAATLHAQFKEIQADYKARRPVGLDVALKKCLDRNVSLIKSIPEGFHRRIQAITATGLSNHRDLHFVKKALLETSNISSKRAELIARDQGNKITNEMALQRSLAVGITHGIWQHVPGKYSSRKTHLKMDGQKFELSKGIYDTDAGQYVKPGELVACNCRYMAVIPGIDD